MVPGTVVTDVGAEKRLDVSQLGRGGRGSPKAEVSDKPLPVRPDVVVLDVFGENAGEKQEFTGWEARKLGHDDLAVVPIWEC